MSSRKKKDTVDPQSLEPGYNNILPLLEKFSPELSIQVGKLLHSNEIKLAFPIQDRVKTWPSFVDKLTRVPLNIRSVTDMQDLVGLRVILLFKRDVTKVENIITDYFKDTRKYDTQDRLKEDQFGYSSIHLIIKVPDSWLTVPSLEDFKDLSAEIQVRTLAQHNWAEASQVLQYKKESTVPRAILRSVYRVSALLETVDLEFERLLVDREDYREELAQGDPDLDNNEPLNVDLLESVLDSIFPKANKDEDEGYAELLDTLRHFKVDNVPALKSILERHLATVMKRELQLSREYKKSVYFSHVGLARTAMSYQFTQEWDEYNTEKSAEGEYQEVVAGVPKVGAEASFSRLSRESVLRWLECEFALTIIGHNAYESFIANDSAGFKCSFTLYYIYEMLSQPFVMIDNYDEVRDPLIPHTKIYVCRTIEIAQKAVNLIPAQATLATGSDPLMPGIIVGYIATDGSFVDLYREALKFKC